MCNKKITFAKIFYLPVYQIKMSDSLLKPVSLKYRSKQNVYGNYKMKWIYPTQYQTSYALIGAGQIQNTYQIQSNVFNTSLSRVNFRITVPAQGAGAYIIILVVRKQ